MVSEGCSENYSCNTPISAYSLCLNIWLCFKPLQNPVLNDKAPHLHLRVCLESHRRLSYIMIKEQEACQCEMWFDGKEGFGWKQVLSERSVCRITQDIAFVFRAVLCSRGGPWMWGVFKKSSLFKVYGRTCIFPL